MCCFFIIPLNTFLLVLSNVVLSNVNMEVRLFPVLSLLGLDVSEKNMFEGWHLVTPLSLFLHTK